MVERSFVKIELLMLLCSLFKHIIDYRVTAFLWHIADDVATEGKKLFAVHLILLFKMLEEHSVAIYLVINLWFIAQFGRVLFFIFFF